MSRGRTSWLFAVSGMLLLSGCSGEPPRAEPVSSNRGGGGTARNAVPDRRPDSTWRSTEQLLLTSEQARDLVPGSFRVSSDGRRFAYVLQSADQQALMIDGQTEVVAEVSPPDQNTTVRRRAVEHIRLETFQFSDDGEHYVYARDVSGTELDYLDRPKEVTYTEIIRDGHIVDWIPHISNILLSHVGISRDGSQWFYYLELPNNPSLNGFYVNNELVAEGVCPNVIATSPTLRYAFIDDSGTVIVDGEKLATYDPINVYAFPEITSRSLLPSRSFRFSEDGTTYGHIAYQRDRMFAVIDGREQPRFDLVYDLVLSPDGRHHAYRARQKGKELVVVDGQIAELPRGQTGYDVVNSVLISADARHWVCLSYRPLEGDVELLVDGRQYAEHRSNDEVQYGPADLQISPDGRQIGYALTRTTAQGTDVLVVHNRREHPACTMLVGSLQFSPDGGSLAYVAEMAGHEGTTLVLDGVPQPSPGAIRVDRAPWLLWSADSRSLAYVVDSSLISQAVVVDGWPGEPYEEIAIEGTGLQFTPEGSLTYLAVRNGEYYWVETHRQ